MKRERLEVRIDPLDPLLFGDNRSARAGEDHLQLDQDPTPPTVFGAIGGRILAKLREDGAADWSGGMPLLGEKLDHLDDASGSAAALAGYCYTSPAGSPRFPKPLHVVVERAGERLVPGPLLAPQPLGERAASSLPLSHRLAAGEDVPEDEETGPLFVDEGVLEEALTGGPVTRNLFDPPENLFLPDRRLGIAMSNERNTTVPGRLFSRPYRRFRSGAAPGADGPTTAGLLAWLDVLPSGDRAPSSLDGIGFLGGDRRRAGFRFAAAPDPPLPDLLDAVLHAAEDGRGLVLYLLTPAVVPEDRFGFPLFDTTGPAIAAALGKPRTISGWRSVGRPRGPRPVRTLYPEGSVFFCEWPPDRPGAEERRRLLRDLWLAPLDPAYANFGFGRALPGVWR